MSARSIDNLLSRPIRFTNRGLLGPRILRWRPFWLLTSVALLAPGSPTSAAAQVAVTTYHYDALRTGWNQNEQTLTQTNVVPRSFGVLHSVTLDDFVDAQPLVVPNVNIAGGTHEVVYVATENNTIYAIDPTTGGLFLTPRHFGSPVHLPPLGLACGNNGPNVGIMATPVIDRARNRMYVITYTQETGPVYRLHALSLSSLADTVASDSITARHTLVATPADTLIFNATWSRQRPALLEANGNIYAGFGSFCDWTDASNSSRGWLLGWTADSLRPLAANELTDRQPRSSSFLSSIWMSGYGVAADATGNVYFVTGNTLGGGAHDNSTNISESVAKISPDLTTVLGLFTPSNVNTLDGNDWDLGSGGVLLLPDQSGSIPHLAVVAGKANGMYLLNRDAVQVHMDSVGAPVAVGACWCGPSYFVGTDNVGRVVASGGSTVTVWKVQNATLTLERSAGLTSGQDGGFFTTISSNGTQAGSAIIWAVSRPTNPSPANVTLYALNGGNASTLFSAVAGTWPQNLFGTQSNNATIVPVVANGRVYVASYKQLSIFGVVVPTHPRDTIVSTQTLAGRPFGLDVSSNNVVYITVADSARVQRVDLPSFAFTGRVAVGSSPTAVGFNPAGDAAWVTNQLSSTVGVIDVASNTQTRTIGNPPLTGNPFVVIAKPDGGTIYVSNNSGNVFALNAVTDALIATFTLGSIVNGFAFHPDGVRLYASQLYNGTVSEINTQTNTVQRNLTIGGTKLQGVAVSKDGSELYVADQGANVLRVVNITSGTQVATVSLQGGGFGVALSPDNVQLFVSEPHNGVVQVIDRASRTVVKTLQTGGTPRRIGFSVAGETAVIANEGGYVTFVQ